MRLFEPLVLVYPYGWQTGGTEYGNSFFRNDTEHNDCTRRMFRARMALEVRRPAFRTA